MRIISFLLRSLLGILTVAIVGGLVVREILLFWATNQVQTDLKTLRQTLNAGDYRSQCLERGAVIVEGEPLVTAQMRFNTSTDYELEILCNQYRLEPVVLKVGKLPPFVEKKPGSSGAFISEGVSGVTLSSFGRERTIYVENETVKTGKVTLEFGSGPQSSCAGYGLKCCELENEIGLGAKVGNAQDCPLSCHSSCQRRPLLLSLTADPFIDPQTRVVELTGAQLLAINYSIQPGSSPDMTVTFDFGDGTVEQTTAVSGSFTHAYNCNTTTCQYTTKLTIVDGNGVPSADSAYSSFKVNVRN